jgi:CheY-like chemotaxis protein
VFDLNALVADIHKMLARMIGEDVQLVTVPAPGLARIKADAGQVEQVIMNLAVNARDAMPGGGRLTIEMANVSVDQIGTEGFPAVRPGAYVLLAVSDTGKGMDRDTQGHLFEPFFTTKGPGQGTGLGLATVYGTVKQSGGYIKVYSEVGRGTTFKVYFPAIQEAEDAGEPERGAAEPPGGREVVLLVEDEEGVRRLTQDLLERLGYRVLAAAGSVEALKMAAEQQGGIDLLLTDVVMPQMSGPQVAEALLPLHAGLKVLYVSGYADDAVVRHGVLEAGMAFLQKPFTTAALAAKVRQVLEQKD